MEVDSSPSFNGCSAANSSANVLSPMRSSSPSTLAELMGSPLFGASIKLKRSHTSSLLPHHRSSPTLHRPGCRTLPVLQMTSLEDKENIPESKAKLETTTTTTTTNSNSTTPSLYRRHVRRRSGSNFRNPAFHCHHHSRSLSSSRSIFKIHSRSSSASSRGIQEALGSTSARSLIHRRDHDLPMDCSTPNAGCTARLAGPICFAGSDMVDSYDASATATTVDDLLAGSEVGDSGLDNSNSEDDDSQLADDAYGGSPLQQRQRARARMEMNNHIRHNLHRATSLINYSSSAGSASCSSIPTHRRVASCAIGSPIAERTNDADDANNNNNGSPCDSRLHWARHQRTQSGLVGRGRVGRVPRLMRSATSLVHSDAADSYGAARAASRDGNSLLSQATLKTFFIEGCTIPHINVDEFHRILMEYRNSKNSNKLCGQYDELVVVDCRFEYEYQGGHIEGAINVSSKSELEQTFFGEPVVQYTASQFTQRSHKLLVFHCEFSSHRGPLMANNLRNWDRCLNKDNYPNLYYPDVVILEGGYKKYYDRYLAVQSGGDSPASCASYVEMQDPQFKDECEKGLDKLRRDNKLSLSRKNSYSSSLSLSCDSGTSGFSSCSSLSLKRSVSSSTAGTSCSSLDFTNSTKFEFRRSLRRKPSVLFAKELCCDTYSSDAMVPCGNGPSSASSSSSSGSASSISPRGIFGGFGSSRVDLDTLCDDGNGSTQQQQRQQGSPPSRLLHHVRSYSQQCSAVEEEPEMYTKTSSYQSTMLRRQHGRHRRAETISCFSYGNGAARGSFRTMLRRN